MNSNKISGSDLPRVLILANEDSQIKHHWNQKIGEWIISLKVQFRKALKTVIIKVLILILIYKNHIKNKLKKILSAT